MVENPLQSRLLFLRGLATYAEPTLPFDDVTVSIQQGTTSLVFIYQSESALRAGRNLCADGLLQHWTTCSLARALARHGDSLLQDAQAGLAARVAFRDLNLRAGNWPLHLVQSLSCLRLDASTETGYGASRLVLSPRLPPQAIRFGQP